MVFSNGIKSPLYETAESKQNSFELKRIPVDHRRTIDQIAMKVGKSGYDSFTGIRLTDNNGDIIVEEVWFETDNSKWVTQKVPEGNDVIGIQCYVEEQTIRRLRFALWKPASDLLENIRKSKMKVEVENEETEKFIQEVK